MAEVTLSSLAHSYKANPSKPEEYALRPLEMTWQDGGAYALLGPSGCGKTTLLNIISGLIKPSQGRVLFDGKDVTDLPTEKRNIAQVFQFPVIYDTMTVHDNLAFPLRNRGMNDGDVRKRVQEVAELLELTTDLKRRASGLSADQKQKISLGRGLVRSDVAAILFDEPLTVIDPHLKWQLRSKLKQIHRQLKLTLIYVTHDQTEALTFADQVVVMYEGSVVQIGTPQQLFEEPAHTFVGYFIGSPGMNLLPAKLSEGALFVGSEKMPIDPVQLSMMNDGKINGGEIAIGIRPEFVGYSTTPRADAVAAQIQRVEDLGNFKIVTAQVGGQSIKAKIGEEQRVDSGACWLVLPLNRTRLYVNGKAI